MLRKIIAGTAVAGALTLGLAGMAGASTPTGSTGNTGANGAAVCARLPKIEARVQKVEARFNDTRIPKLQDKENAAKAAGDTTLADRIANRITKIQDREAKVNARLQKVEAKCSTAGTSTNG